MSTNIENQGEEGQMKNHFETASKSRLVVTIDFNKGGKKTATSIRARKKFASLEERISHLEKANERVSKRL